MTDIKDLHQRSLYFIFIRLFLSYDSRSILSLNPSRPCLESLPQNLATMHPRTFTYKQVGDVKIDLDLYLPPSPKDLPLLVWFHGGGLLQGSRASVAPHMLAGVDTYAYALVSADYRLAPQVAVDEIVQDVLDCLAFVRSALPGRVGTGIIDAGRLAVSGSSAGGYLALLAGLYAQPGPKVVLPIYPITNPLGQFFTTPQPYPRGKVEESVVAPFLDRGATPVSFNVESSPRSNMYGYMLQEANLADLLSVSRTGSKFLVAEQIARRGAYVPCYIVHGDADQFVGVEQADEVVEALRVIGSTYEYERIPGVDHSFDTDESVGLEGLYKFMMKHL